jgi:hypothetical protein
MDQSAPMRDAIQKEYSDEKMEALLAAAWTKETPMKDDWASR